MAKQPETKVRFSIFNEEFNQGLREISKESTTLRKEFRLQSEQMKDTATETEKLESKMEYLGKEQDNVRKKIELTAQQLNKAKEYYGKNSNEANKLSNQLLDLQYREQKLENDINSVRKSIESQSQEMDNARTSTKKFEDSLEKLEGAADKTGNALSIGVSAPLTAVAGIAGKTASDIDGASRLLTGALGATGDEARQLKEDMEALWYDGIGNNPDELARAMMLVKQNIKDINSGEELQTVTKQMLYLAEATDSDMSEATRGVNQLMHNFGITSSKALDLFTKGQQEGINFSQEMFDNVAEYAPLFRDMGFAAEEYFSLLVNGAENGAYNLDYINDIMKEFNIRIQDGSETTADAIGELSSETQVLFKRFQDGEATAQDLFKAVIPELEKMDDQVKANQIGIDLFGTKFEDMGATTVYTLDDINDSMADTEGTMEDFAKTQDEVFGREAQRTLRGLLQALEPVGRELLEIGRDVTPKIRELTDWFINLDDESKKTFMTLGAGAIALGPTIKGVATLSNLLGNASGAGLIAKFAAMGPAGVVGLAIAGIATLGTGIYVATENMHKLHDISTETADAMMDQYQSNIPMIEGLDELRNKCLLTNDEFERYLDLQSRLKSESDPQAIATIKDEMNQLQEKSGLSNTELDKMVGYNDSLVESIPEATAKITDQGNRVAETTDKLKDYNQEIANAAKRELESQLQKSLANEVELREQIKESQIELNRLTDIEFGLRDIVKAKQDGTIGSFKEKLLLEQESVEKAYQEAVMHGEVSQELSNRKNNLERLLALADMDLDSVRGTLATTIDLVDEQKELINGKEAELNKTGEIVAKMVEQELIASGISEEKAKQAVKDAEVSSLLEQQISALQTQKEELYKQTDPALQVNDSFQASVKAIDDQIIGLQNAKGNIEDLIDEAGQYNRELAKDINKTVNTVIKHDPAYSNLNDPVTKAIYLKTYGATPIATYKDGTTFHPGGPAIVGEEGPELVRQGNKWSLHGFGLIPDLERGADVLTAEQTRKIMSGLMNLPTYASGVGVGTSQVLNNRLNNMGSNLANQQSMQNKIVVNVEASDVIMDGRVVGSILWKPVKEHIDRDAKDKKDFRGE